MIDKDLLRYTKGKNYYLFLITLFSFFNLAISVSSTFLLSTSIDRFIQGDKKGYYYILGSFSLILLFILFYILKNRLADKLASFVSIKIRDDIYKKYLLLDGNSKLKTGDIAQLSTEGIEQLRLYYSSYLPSFFYSMIAPISLFILFVFFDYKVAIIYLVCVPLIPISIILVSKWAKRIFSTYWNKYLDLGGNYLDSLKGMKELLIFNYDKKKEEEMKKNSEEFRKITMKVLVMQLFSTTIMDVVAYGGAAIGITFTLLDFKNGNLNLILTIFMILTGAEFFLPLRALGSSFHIAMNGDTAGKKVISLLNEKEIDDGKNIIEDINKIEIKNLSYKYLDSSEYVLKNISIDINRGFTSILGNSGCGKSTLAKILVSSLKNYEGSIKFDGIELNTINRTSLRKKVAYLELNSYLLSLNIRDLFKFYNLNISDETIFESLEKVDLKERILEAGGLDYVIKNNGDTFSGGERQRLLLALYLNTDKKMMVFDEITSNIDKDSEKIIVDNIKELSKDKIVIFISHRVKNALLADKIYYLSKEDGIIINDTVSNLLHTNNIFSNQVKEESKWEEIL